MEDAGKRQGGEGGRGSKIHNVLRKGRVIAWSGEGGRAFLEVGSIEMLRWVGIVG